MTFGQKLKKLRTDNMLTQEQLADKLFVTRTAVSKWETDRGFPSIDSLKAVADLFNVRIDDLLSEDDIENKKLADEKKGRRMYYIAVAFLALTTAFTLATYFSGQKYFGIGSVAGLTGYVVFALLSKPKYKRVKAKKNSRSLYHFASRDLRRSARRDNLYIIDDLSVSPRKFILCIISKNFDT